MTPAPKCPNCGREMVWGGVTWVCGPCAVLSTSSDHTTQNGLLGMKCPNCGSDMTVATHPLEWRTEDGMTCRKCPMVFVQVAAAGLPEMESEGGLEDWWKE